jgi:hypothetical protein
MKKYILNVALCAAFALTGVTFTAQAQDYSGSDPYYSNKYDVRGDKVELEIIEETTYKTENVVTVKEMNSTAPNFYTMDKDKSKSLSKEEFTSVDGMDWNIFTFLDANKDGSLSEEEYKAIATIAVSEDGTIKLR